MKKEYTIPTIYVEAINIQETILAGSIDITSDPGDPDVDIDGKDIYFYYEDEIEF